MNINVTINFSEDAEALLQRIADAVEDGVRLDSGTAETSKAALATTVTTSTSGEEEEEEEEEAPKPKKKAAKKSAKKATKKSAKKAKGNEEDNDEPSPERARDLALKLMKAGKSDELKAILADYGVKRVSELGEDQLEDACAEMAAANDEASEE